MEKRWLDLCRERQIGRDKKRHLFDFLSVLSTFSCTEKFEDTDLERPLPSGWIGSGVEMEVAGDKEGCLF